MADWYVSSVAWTAIPQFAASTAYTVGNIVRPLTAPAFGAQYAFRCTTAGTSSTEPTWPAANAATVTTGGATFTNVTSQSTYGWGAAAGNLYSIGTAVGGSNRPLIGDRVFVSSDHSETNVAAGPVYGFGTNSYGVIQFISVNRAGSVPPVAADALSGATIISSNATANYLSIDAVTNTYWQGFTFNLGGAGIALFLGYNGYKQGYYKNCALVLSTSATTAVVSVDNYGIGVVLDNTTIQFNNAGQRIAAQAAYPYEFKWINTPTAVLGTVPSSLVNLGGGVALPMVFRGVDLSAVTTTLYTNGLQVSGKILFDSCRIAPGVVRLAQTFTNNSCDELELVNCYDGSNFLAERHTPAGDVTTEFTITLSSGAQDNVGSFSHKMVSSTRADIYSMPLESFWMDVNNATIGGPRTATVEVTSSVTLNTNDISLMVEYEGTAGSSLASFVFSQPSALTTVAALPTSTATWNSLPATPVKQLLSVTFTPRTTGRVRAQVRLGKPSTTVYIDPRITIT